MSINWKIGDKLLCVDATPLEYASGFPTGLRAGEEYEMLDKHICTVSFVCVGVPTPLNFYYSYCPRCNHMTERVVFHHAWRFIKLDPDFKLEDELVAEQERQINKLLRHALNYGVGSEAFKDILIHQGNTK